jgi:hypothetical protein
MSTRLVSLPAGIAVVVIACLIADAFWFYLGRRAAALSLNTSEMKGSGS